MIDLDVKLMYIKIGGDKMRVQVNLSDDMVSKVDNYAKMMGVSRSALCSMLIGQGIMSYDKGIELISKFGNDYLLNSVEENKVIADDENIVAKK